MTTKDPQSGMEQGLKLMAFDIKLNILFYKNSIFAE